jgi:hypothetical protein
VVPREACCGGVRVGAVLLCGVAEGLEADSQVMARTARRTFQPAMGRSNGTGWWASASLGGRRLRVRTLLMGWDDPEKRIAELEPQQADANAAAAQPVMGGRCLLGVAN